MSILSEIYSAAEQDITGLGRIKLASSLQTTIQYIAYTKKWTSAQLPFVQALVKLLEQEKDELVKLGLYELTLNHPPEEKKDADSPDK